MSTTFQVLLRPVTVAAVTTRLPASPPPSTKMTQPFTTHL